MFAISDPQIVLGYGLAIGFTLACIVYGLYYGYRGEENGS
jgi:hypothetical protein